jgi:nucleotide-binding universal stress UspA family protein
MRRLPTTVVQVESTEPDIQNPRERQIARTATVVKAAAESGDGAAAHSSALDIQLRVPLAKRAESAISTEAKKGYGLLFIGREPAAEADRFQEQITRVVAGFTEAFAIVIARGKHVPQVNAPLKILVPVNGTPASRHGAELAIALAEGTAGSVTALHVPSARVKRRGLRDRYGFSFPRSSIADAIIREVVRLGEVHRVQVTGAVRTRSTADESVLRELQRGGYSLLVMGVTPLPAEQLFFGEVASALLERASCSIVFLASESVSAAC